MAGRTTQKLRHVDLTLNNVTQYQTLFRREYRKSVSEIGKESRNRHRFDFYSQGTEHLVGGGQGGCIYFSTSSPRSLCGDSTAINPKRVAAIIIFNCLFCYNPTCLQILSSCSLLSFLIAHRPPLLPNSHNGTFSNRNRHQAH